MPKRNPRRTDKEWLDLIQECRSSGLSDKCWCSGTSYPYKQLLLPDTEYCSVDTFFIL